MKDLFTKEEVKQLLNQCVQVKMNSEHIEMYFNSNSDLSPADWLNSPDREMSTEDYVKIMRGDEAPAAHTVAKI